MLHAKFQDHRTLRSGEEKCTKYIYMVTSSQKGNDRLPESHYKSMGTYKTLKGS